MHFCHQELMALVLALDPTNWIALRYYWTHYGEKLRGLLR